MQPVLQILPGLIQAGETAQLALQAAFLLQGRGQFFRVFPGARGGQLLFYFFQAAFGLRKVKASP
jgi:hypothetical protein